MSLFVLQEKIESNLVTYLNGPGTSAKYFSLILGGDVYLNAKGINAEIAHRAVYTDGKIIQRGRQYL